MDLRSEVDLDALEAELSACDVKAAAAACDDAFISELQRPAPRARRGRSVSGDEPYHHRRAGAVRSASLDDLSVMPSCAAMHENEFIEEYELPAGVGAALFRIIDTRGSGRVDEAAYTTFRERLEEMNANELSTIVMRLIDMNGDGSISGEELLTLLREQGMNDRIAERMVHNVLDRAAAISVHDFARLVAANPVACKAVSSSLNATFSDRDSKATFRQRLVKVGGGSQQRPDLRPSRELPWHDKTASGSAPAAKKGGWLPFTVPSPHVLWTHGSSLAVFAVRFLQFRYTRGSGLALAVAKGAGLVLLYLLALVYCSKLRMLAWFVPRALRKWPSHTSLHAHAGVGAFAWSVVHAAAHCARPGLVVLARAEARTTTTGALALACFTAMTATAVSRSSAASRYRPFLLLHHAHWAVVPLMMAHCWAVPHRPTLLGLLTVLIAVSYGLEYARSWKATMHLCRPMGSNTSYVSVPLGEHPLTEGAYYRLQCPHLSRVEWHPFSLACSNATMRAEFIVKDLGAWTHALHASLADASARGVALTEEMRVRGPYYAPALKARTARRPLLVASGIGITPFLSVLHAKVYEFANRELEERRFRALFPDKLEVCGSGGRQRNRSFTSKVAPSRRMRTASLEKLEKQKQTRLLWMVPDFAYIDFFLDYLVILMRLVDDAAHPPARIKIFFTGVRSRDLGTLIFDLMVALHYTSLGGPCIDFAIGRPDLAVEIEAAAACSAFGCGQRGLMGRVERECADNGVPFEAEEFQDETLGKLWRGFGAADAPKRKSVSKEGAVHVAG